MKKIKNSGDSGARAAFPSAADMAAGRIRGREHGLLLRPYWWEAAPRQDQPPPELPKDCDVVIVGSGFTGLSAALTLTRRGRKAVVLDKGVPGFGASTRNGGQVGSGNQKFRVKRLIELRGKDKALAMLREGVAMLDYIERLIETEKIECHFRRCGRFRAAIRPEHYESMARDMEDLKAFLGVESFMVPKSEQLTEIGSDIYFGGSVLPNDAALHPGLYHAGLMQRIAAADGRVIGNAAVTAIAATGKGFHVVTPAGEIACRNVIIATNGYTDRIVPSLATRIVSVGSAIIATGDIPEEIYRPLMPKGRVYGNTNRVFYYFRGAPDARRMVWGGRVSHTAASTSAQAYSHLVRDMLHVFPALRDVPITHAWDGQIGYTHDEVPHLGKTAEGIHYALGYCGTGVSRATYFGNKIALQLLGDNDGRTAFDDLAFPPFPVHPIAKRMPPVVETWYRVRDTWKF